MWVCYHGSTRRLNREVGFCGFVITGAPITGAPEGSTGRLVFVGLLSWEHPKAQPGSWFLWVCYHGSTRRLNREVGFCCFWRSPGLNLRPLVYKTSDLTTAPRSFFFFFFFLGETSTIVGCVLCVCCSVGSTGRIIFVVDFWRSPDTWFTRRVILPLHHGGFLFFLLGETSRSFFLYYPV